ncbi:F-box protein At1g10110-like [Telopea speciosissima]|uniref:F-box protein At1g10110-like n=1 Tax=Telopea speciosissima TaxID=54955 RepID=UPI001CC6FAEB|nr:F-box protein At1g10110-like [Telopea speciosissima]
MRSSGAPQWIVSDTDGRLCNLDSGTAERVLYFQLSICHYPICTRQGKGMGNWSKLCNDILGLIVDQFSAIEDVVHFGAVCRPWRSVLAEKLHFSTIADPWLMLAEKEDNDNRGFYSLSTQKVYNLNLPEARGRKCWSSCGWLITLGLDLEIHLLNPFSREQIRLPPQPTLPRQYPLILV